MVILVTTGRDKNTVGDLCVFTVKNSPIVELLIYDALDGLEKKERFRVFDGTKHTFLELHRCECRFYQQYIPSAASTWT